MMDATYNSATTGNGDDIPKNHYVSCIRVDGIPILPPLMTEEKRAEMRRYRELAIQKEVQLKENAASKTKTRMNLQKHDAAIAAQKMGVSNNVVHAKIFSPSSSPTSDDPVTSTPRVNRISLSKGADSNKNAACATLNFEESAPTSSTNNTVVNTSDIPEGVLRERKIIILPSDLDKTQSSEPSGRSSSAMSYDGDEDEKVEVDIESDGNDSGENFASVASSTGTFVVRRSDGLESNLSNSNENSGRKNTLESLHTAYDFPTSEDEDNAPPTVVRKPPEEPIFSRRKRPAKFFDVDGSETPKSTAYLPNTVPDDNDGVEKPLTNSGTSLKFSPVPHTNFSTIAKSLTNEFAQKVSATLKSSGLTIGSISNSGESYGVISKQIPSSVDKANNEFDTISNSSDKENINILLEAKDPKKHVRKLSYTLAAPSAVLLEAVSKEKNYTQALETVPSAPSSAGIQSGQPTPEKYQTRQMDTKAESIHTISMKGVDQQPLFNEAYHHNNPSLTSALANLNLGRGKEAHLARFLGEQENQCEEKEIGAVLHQEDRLQLILKQMQEEQNRKLEELAERHRQQELLLKKQFESELEKLKEKLNSTLNSSSSTKSYKISPNSRLDTSNSVARSPAATASAEPGGDSTTALSPEEHSLNTETNSKIVTSGMSGISFSEHTKSAPRESVYQFKGDVRSKPSIMKQIVHVGGGSTELAGVGLSKLQSRMQMMSPSLFRIPADAKSPLLKGLVFLDPLDKPRPPVRIPAKALDPDMKPKFDKISAAVKGFLTRRILHTEKVQIIVQTIRDTVDLLMKLYEEAPMSDSATSVKPQDHELHQRLIQQLTGACRSFHDVFFKLTTKERMAIIATDREKLKAKALRLLNSPTKPSISNATLKSIERRMSHRSSPKRDSRRQRSSKAFDPETFGSLSVKAKPIKSFNISPKRRRISYWDERNSNRPSFSLAKADVNGNSSLKTPLNSARSQISVVSSASARSTRSSSAAIGDTFIVPSSVPSKTGRRESTSTTYTVKTISARSTQSSHSSASINNTRSTGRTSLSRQKPWK